MHLEKYDYHRDTHGPSTGPHDLKSMIHMSKEEKHIKREVKEMMTTLVYGTQF